MSRKHFIMLAAEIRLIPKMDARLMAAIAVGKAALKANDRFDLDKFLLACEV